MALIIFCSAVLAGVIIFCVLYFAFIYKKKNRNRINRQDIISDEAIKSFEKMQYEINKYLNH